MKTINSKENKTSQQKPLGENTATYCFIGEIDWPKMGDGFVVVGDECGLGAPPCSSIVQAPLGFKEEVVEWTGTYMFNKEGYYPKPLTIFSGGRTYFLRDGEFKLIPVTAPKEDMIYAVPLSGSFYEPYEIETCFNKNLNNGKGLYQYSYKSIGEVDKFIHKPIIIQVADYSNDPYAMKSIDDLETIPFDSTCRALLDFEYNRYRKTLYDDDHFFNKLDIIYVIVEAYWEHEKYHKRDAMRFMNEKYDEVLLKIYKPDGYFTLKTLKKHLQTTFSCSQFIRSFKEAKEEGEKYFNKALKEFSNYFKENWYGNTVKILFDNQWKIYIEEELYAHWSDSVQKKITKYQLHLISRLGFDSSQCKEKLKEIGKLWEPFKKYRNSL